MYCGKCGAKVKEGNKYCIYCGAELEKQVIEEQKKLEQNNQTIEKEELPNLNNLHSNDNNENNKKTSTIWLDLITAFWFIIGMYNAIWGLISLADENTYTSSLALLFLIIGSLQIATFFCVHSRKKAGYYLFIITTWNSLFVNNLIKFTLPVSIETNDYSFIIFIEIIIAIIFCVPNNLYIYNRKNIFGIEEKEIEDEEI